MLARLFNTMNGSGDTGGHAIYVSNVMVPTTSDAITPRNPRIVGTVQSTPVVPVPRYFNNNEAAALTDRAQATKEMVKTTAKAYKALESIGESDAAVHGLHRGYQSAIAAAELQKKTADAGLAKTLHGLRPAYARLGNSIGEADRRATESINRIRSRMHEL